MEDIVIFGCGGFGREVLQLLHAINAEKETWNCLGFVVETGFSFPETVHGLPVTDDITTFGMPGQLSVALGIGAPQVRKRVVKTLEYQGYASPILVHPNAWLGDNISLNKGCIICGGAMLTTDIVLKEHVHINLSATVGHDAVIGEFTTVSPGVNISGNVDVQPECDLGTGSALIQGVKVGGNTVIGAGAAVIRDIPENAVAVGVPAKVIKSGI